MPALVRAQSLRGYRDLVTDLGGNPTRLLRKAKVDPEALDQLSALISFENMIDLLELSAEQLDCRDFGFRLAERQDIGILGTLAVAIRHSATVGEALDCASKYLGVHNPAVGFTVAEGHPSGGVVLDFEILLLHPQDWAQTCEHGVALAWRILNLLSGGQAHLRSLSFPHAAVGTNRKYQRRFPAPITFEAPRATLTIAEADLDLAISEHNEELHDVAERYLSSQLPPSDGAFKARVRQAIEAHVGTGACSCRQVANALYMHPRTLQRRLKEEGTTFEEIKDDVRRDLAEQYLSHPEMPLTQVTVLLDYSEQSALGRSCRRWFHTSPKDFRNRLLSGASEPSMS